MFNLHRQGAIDVLTCQVPIVSDHVDALSRAANTVLDKGIPDWIIDLQQVPLIDSRGLEFLLNLRDLSLEKMGTMKLASPNPLVRDIFAVTGLEREFEIFPCLTSATGSFSI